MANKKEHPVTDGETVTVMDLGTNTFHLLIARGRAANPQEIFHITEPVKLGEGGINSGVIQPAAYKRGIAALRTFHQHILTYKAGRVKAIATSALRSASNGKDFIDEVMAKTGIQIEAVDGSREAGYIYEGVKASKCLSKRNSLILDIGGGSVEFIVGNEAQILWKQSFEIGAARLMDKFHRADPIPASLIKDLDSYLEEILTPLFEAIAKLDIQNIAGSSGAFETFAEMIELKKGNPFDLTKNRTYKFDTTELVNITDWLIESSHFERENAKGIIPIRVDMIVAASLITRYVMKKLGIESLIMSTYSLKEGVMAEMLGKIVTN
jgi:exopolyphosphatase/guanosine-5'-triphosphate,3'-diphosphate pyrophosphatase